MFNLHTFEHENKPVTDITQFGSTENNPPLLIMTVLNAWLFTDIWNETWNCSYMLNSLNDSDTVTVARYSLCSDDVCGD